MKAERFAILVHPVFTIPLLLLLLNDNYLKTEYHNGITGKLSDATGLMLLSLLLSMLTGRKIWAVLFSAAFFTWWKSPLSNEVIDLLNGIFNNSINRIADLTDLFTLPAVLIVYVVKPNPVLAGTTLKKLGSITSGVICLFAFCRTSTLRYANYNLRDHEVRMNENFGSKKSKDEILAKFRKLNITFYEDSIRFYPLRKDQLYFRDSISNSMLTLQWPQFSMDSELYERRVQPFYIIPEYIVDGKRITDIEFYITPRGKGGQKSAVQIESFKSYRNVFQNNGKKGTEMDQIRKEMKKLFRK